MSADAVIKEVNTLRTLRLHLDGQCSAGIDTAHATLAEAELALASVEIELERAEAEARKLPEAAYLFSRGKRLQIGTGRTDVRPPQSSKHESTPNTKEASMARKSNGKATQEALEAVLVDLRKAEKSAGTTKWALSGAGAAKNPPDAKKKKHLKEKLAGEQARVAELRARRDELKAQLV